ncbi:hypothetical protein BJ508DRAFT_366542 [Ascobolus immersus RN42]|uniref:Uncharacterized protein n=1 Tax=Ascobolus immersus RN42 TaxID=1160509 RepID=A0A3N4HP64_ASCIM|nr:hypothetical protein BJ508DRAFT_366542 [Ascobolus immersus RN42]
MGKLSLNPFSKKGGSSETNCPGSSQNYSENTEIDRPALNPSKKVTSPTIGSMKSAKETVKALGQAFFSPRTKAGTSSVISSDQQAQMGVFLQARGDISNGKQPTVPQPADEDNTNGVLRIAAPELPPFLPQPNGDSLEQFCNNLRDEIKSDKAKIEDIHQGRDLDANTYKTLDAFLGRVATLRTVYRYVVEWIVQSFGRNGHDSRGPYDGMMISSDQLKRFGADLDEIARYLKELEGFCYERLIILDDGNVVIAEAEGGAREIEPQAARCGVTTEDGPGLLQSDEYDEEYEESDPREKPGHHLELRKAYVVDYVSRLRKSGAGGPGLEKADQEAASRALESEINRRFAQGGSTHPLLLEASANPDTLTPSKELGLLCFVVSNPERVGKHRPPALLYVWEVMKRRGHKPFTHLDGEVWMWAYVTWLESLRYKECSKGCADPSLSITCHHVVEKDGQDQHLSNGFSMFLTAELEKARKPYASILMDHETVMKTTVTDYEILQRHEEANSFVWKQLVEHGFHFPFDHEGSGSISDDMEGSDTDTPRSTTDVNTPLASVEIHQSPGKAVTMVDHDTAKSSATNTRTVETTDTDAQARPTSTAAKTKIQQSTPAPRMLHDLVIEAVCVKARQKAAILSSNLLGGLIGSEGKDAKELYEFFENFSVARMFYYSVFYHTPEFFKTEAGPFSLQTLKAYSEELDSMQTFICTTVEFMRGQLSPFWNNPRYFEKERYAEARYVRQYIREVCAELLTTSEREQYETAVQSIAAKALLAENDSTIGVNSDRNVEQPSLLRCLGKVLRKPVPILDTQPYRTRVFPMPHQNNESKVLIELRAQILWDNAVLVAEPYDRRITLLKPIFERLYQYEVDFIAKLDRWHAFKTRESELQITEAQLKLGLSFIDFQMQFLEERCFGDVSGLFVDRADSFIGNAWHGSAWPEDTEEQVKAAWSDGKRPRPKNEFVLKPIPTFMKQHMQLLQEYLPGGCREYYRLEKQRLEGFPDEVQRMKVAKGKLRKQLNEKRRNNPQVQNLSEFEFESLKKAEYAHLEMKNKDGLKGLEIKSGDLRRRRDSRIEALGLTRKLKL